MFGWILLEFWYQTRAKLVSNWDQTSMLTLSDQNQLNASGLDFSWISEVEVGSKHRPKIDPTMESKMRCLLASICFFSMLVDFGRQAGKEKRPNIYPKSNRTSDEKKKVTKMAKKSQQEAPTQTGTAPLDSRKSLPLRGLFTSPNQEVPQKKCRGHHHGLDRRGSRAEPQDDEEHCEDLGDRARGQVVPEADRPGGSVRGERAIFTRLVLGCIEAKFCKQICVGKLSPRSTKCTPLHRSRGI